MGDKTKIEWTAGADGTPGATWNPVTGCTEVSPGCDLCYAKTFAERWRGIPGHHFEHGFDVTLRPERLDQPQRWRRPRRIFVNSMSDLFHEAVPDEFIARVWQVMAACPQHTFLILTKRHARMRSWVSRCAVSPGGWITHDGSDPARACDGTGVIVGYPYRPEHVVYGRRGKRTEYPASGGWPLPNVWLGVSAEDRHWAGIRVPALRRTPAAVRFVSAEPLLGPVDGVDLGGVNWVIAGGESGPGARPCDLAWLRNLRDQCADAGVAYFLKQVGAVAGRELGAGPKGGDWEAWPADLRVREYPAARLSAAELAS